MNYAAHNPEEYISQLPDDRKEAVQRLRETIKANLPTGYEEAMSYGMIGYVVPFSIYPPGYDSKRGEPLPLIHIASQKNHIALYHLGIYSFPELLEWFQQEYAKRVPTKLDMGKGCIRFKKPEQIPYDLIAELCQKITAEEWVEKYRASRNRK
jgi:uncharacterized protein YdhG (YjbR/CyaY superfamily)